MTGIQAYRQFEDKGKVSGRVVELALDEFSAREVTLRVAYASINYKGVLAATGQGKIIRAYPRIATDLRPRRLDKIAHIIALEVLPAACAKELKAEMRGRTVIRLQP